MKFDFMYVSQANAKIDSTIQTGWMIGDRS